MEVILQNLDVVWFILVCVLFAGFFTLEGFDYGVGILLPFLGKTDVERRQMINTVGPVWDGNQVWMIYGRWCNILHPSTCLCYFVQWFLLGFILDVSCFNCSRRSIRIP